MIALALAVFSAAAPLETTVSVPEPERPPRILAVYVEPLAAAALSTTGTYFYNATTLYLPTGFTLALAPHWGISAEVAGLLVSTGSTKGWGISASVGPTWLPSGRGVDGWFVSPKLTFNLSALPILKCLPVGPFGGGCGPGDVSPGPNGLASSALAGIDAGYQFALGPVALAMLAGVGAGIGSDENGSGLVTPLVGSGSREHTTGFVWSLNVAMLRVGFAH